MVAEDLSNHHYIYTKVRSLCPLGEVLVESRSCVVTGSSNSYWESGSWLPNYYVSGNS
jgi:hypothetical protein